MGENHVTKATDALTGISRRTKSLVALPLLASTMMMPSPSFAQASSAQASSADADEQLSGEIIVTARKREERAIDVPASLNVFSGTALKDSGVNSLTDLQYRSPGLNIAVSGGTSRISLRGVGTNIASGSASVAVHVDGIYIPQLRFALAEMFDIDRVEVLKGPEGTLYGRNATGGAINLLSKAPGDRFGVDGYVGYGSYNLVTAQAGVTVPFDERGGVRISAAFANDDGYTRNLNALGGEIDDRNYMGLRLRGRYDLTETLTADVTAQYSRDKGTLGFGSSNNPDSPVYASLPPQRESPRRINVDTLPSFIGEGLLLSGTLTLDLGDVTLKSITGHLDYDTDNIADVDGSGGHIGYTDSTATNNFFSQEFQLSGGTPGVVNWTAGAYYSRETSNSRGIEIDADYPDPTPYLYTDQSLRTGGGSYAVFGEITVPLGEKLSVLAGARYTHEKQDAESSFAAPLFFPEPIDTSGSTKDNAFTPKLLVEYRPYDGGKLYASVTRGFKSGGVNLGTTANTYKPEKIWAYEIGSKNSFADGQFELGLAGFYYDYTNLQLRSVLFTPNGIIIEVNNAAKAPIYGAEASLVARPADGFTIDANAAYLNSELKGFVSPVTLTELTGLPLPLSPKWSFTAGAEYAATLGNSGKITLRSEVTYQSAVYFPQFADIDRERQKGYALLNANLRYDLPGDDIYVALIGRNLTNTTYKQQRFYFAGFADIENYGPPRIVEARVGFKF